VKNEQNLVAVDLDKIESKIFFIRGKKVMLDSDLAFLYQVETFNLNKAVKRNTERFPDDFMFQLSEMEFKNFKLNLIFQSGISSHGGRRHFPYVFTEQGVAMLSSVLKSKRAIQVNIQIMRTFTKIREMMAAHRDLREKIEELEKKYDKNFAIVFDAIRKLVTEEERPKHQIGFNTD
jgi:hypothetical protein